MSLAPSETYIDFKNFRNERLQLIADYVTNKVSAAVSPVENIYSNVKLLNGVEINMSLWYYHHQGHTMEGQILKLFPPRLNLIKKDKEEVLKIEIIEGIVDDITGILSNDILEIL